MATKKVETKESLEAKIETAKLNLQNPKIAANKGLLAQTKKRIAEWEKQIAALGKKGAVVKAEKPAKVVKTVVTKVKEEKSKTVTATKTKSPSDLKTKSIRFQIAYWIHNGKEKEEILKIMPDINAKHYTDAAYHYKRDLKAQVVSYMKENNG